LIEKDLLPKLNELTSDRREYALPSMEGTQFGRDTWLADSGASCHMGNTDDGMFDVKAIDEPITMGNGKSLRATKVGKLRRTVKQVNGDTVDIVLEGYKCVPGLHMNLFAVVKALDGGWDIGNDGIKMYLEKKDIRITFDRVYNTATGSLCGVDILPRSGKGSKNDVAVPATETATDEDTVPRGSKQSWDINRMHHVYNHADEETLRRTAAHFGWTVTGKFEACADCLTGNIKQKPVPKTTETKSETPGERVFIDITSVQYRSLGGSKFWVGCVDDATDQTWSSFLKRKSDLPALMMRFLRRMKARGTPVKFIRCDNAGENVDLKNKCQQTTDLNDIEFEFTARDSPQFNGRIERKFATLTGRVRAMLNAAKLTQELRNQLWCEAASTATDIENLLVKRNQEESPRLKFFEKDLPKPESLRQFGEMAIIKMGKEVKGKLTDRGIPVMYLGREKDHAGDTFRFLNVATKRVLVSRDAIWLNKVYGLYKGTHRSVLMDTVTVLPTVEAIVRQVLAQKGALPDKAKDADNDDRFVDAQQQNNDDDDDENEFGDAVEEEAKEEAKEEAAPRAGMSTRRTNTVQSDGRPTEVPTAKAVREARKLDTYIYPNRDARTIVERARELTANEATPADAVTMAINAMTMINKFGADIDDHIAELAMAAVIEQDYSKVDPTTYKDIFEVPKSFDEAWNHPDPFQREKWREAITKEFAKMERNKVWKKVQRSVIPTGRRCVKHKWVFEWKRDGRARARLVACGYSQVAGVDFTSVFSPVANDVSFRIMLICMIMWQLDAMIFDVETAFLNGDLEEEIYMDCPEGMESEPGECLLLLKSIYGLVQAARQYFKKFESILKKIGFQQCGSDPCLFMRKNEYGIVMLLCYVDDNLCIGNKAALAQVCKEIVANGLNITEKNELTDYLSCEIRFNADKTQAWVGQPHMVKKLEKTFGDEVSGLQRYKTPGTPGQGLIRAKVEEDKVEQEQQSRYRTGVGMLLYLIKHSRPDICNGVRELTKCLDGATQVAYKEMLRIIKYVLDSKNRGLRVAPLLKAKTIEWELLVYSDSDWAGDKDDRKSISGYMIFLNGVLICWRSKSQQSVALSSSEAELYACSEAAKEIPFIVQILLFLGIPVKLPVQVKVDNMGAIYMTENSTSSSRTRHIDTRYFFVKDMQNDGLCKVDFVRSGDNVSDIATKNVTGEVHDSHLEKYTAERDAVIGGHPAETGRVLEGIPAGSYEGMTGDQQD
jgi:Reverse transcriptase (RNA-dependent DNA polymerase)